ncbi:hypothetical protein AK812_SmicGene21168 [Symbiodinium microadriaticum]|uniref:Uncharacterized protein n=1 Tax=Symbiodinium microadriaticum TaxID=2951 RepID=A0A1Q9DN29_SYMMI|nr:hypothetical protein AK812_SmicGene21168 [Symbiodinium microadriaticum]
MMTPSVATVGFFSFSGMQGITTIAKTYPLAYKYVNEWIAKQAVFPSQQDQSVAVLQELAALPVTDLAQMAFDLTKHPLASILGLDGQLRLQVVTAASERLLFAGDGSADWSIVQEFESDWTQESPASRMTFLSGRSLFKGLSFSPLIPSSQTYAWRRCKADGNRQRQKQAISDAAELIVPVLAIVSIVVPFWGSEGIFVHEGLEEVPEPCVYANGLWLASAAYPGSVAMEARILSCLTLKSLPSAARVARRWRVASALGFSKLLWRKQAQYSEVMLPDGKRRLGAGFVTFLRDGTALILAACHEAEEKTSRQWPFSRQLFADVLDMREGTYQKIEITKMRDDMAQLLGDDSARRQAVSSTRDHFVFHVNTFTGKKIAGAVRIPKIAGGSAVDPPSSMAPVSFAKSWASGEPIAELEALAVSLSFDIVCGCGIAPRGLQPPPVVVWDLSTGLVLQQFCHHAVQPDSSPVIPASPLEPVGGGYRFSVGNQVECFTSEGWQPGRVIEQNYRESDWPAGVSAPYQVRLTGDTPALIYVPQDLPRLIRPIGNRQAYESGEVDIQVAIHPTRRCMLVGLWQKSRGRVHCLEVVP